LAMNKERSKSLQIHFHRDLFNHLIDLFLSRPALFLDV
jgi:hypothetical protein